MDQLIQCLVGRLETLKEEHETAKKDYLAHHLNYCSISELIRQQEFSHAAQFTTNNVRKCLEQHEYLE